MIYTVPAPDEPLSQADILDACPIFGLETAAGVDLEAAPARWQERVVVLTQACDLAQTKTSKVLVALLHPAQSLIERGILKGPTIRDQKDQRGQVRFLTFNTRKQIGKELDPPGVPARLEERIHEANMDQTLKDHLQTHRCKGFKPVPHYSALGDFVTYYFRDERAYEEPVDEFLTVYLSMKTKELVGCKINGIRHILQTAGDFGVTLDGDDVRLGFFFFVGAAAAKNAKQKQWYEELGRAAKAVTVERKELLAAPR